MYHDERIAPQERRLAALDKYIILTPTEVMDILGIGKNSVYTLLNSGRLQGFRVGRSWRVSVDALENFMLFERKESHP